MDNEKTYKIDPDKWVTDPDLYSDPVFKLFTPMQIPITTVTSPFIKIITVKDREIIVNINQIQIVTTNSIKIDDKWYSISLEIYEKLLTFLNVINK